MDLNENHYGAFLRSFKYHKKDAWTGKEIRNWASHVVNDDRLLKSLPDAALSRSELRIFCGQRDKAAEVKFLAVASWGGIKITNFKAAWNCYPDWRGTLEAMISSELSRDKDYARFLDLKHRGVLQGMRPPFYTKLLHFLRRTPDAYMMDQWVAKSVNLLTGRSAVHLAGGYVTDDNTAADYEKFCQVVDHLAARTRLRPDEVEERLFGGSINHPDSWRNYVKKHWK